MRGECAIPLRRVAGICIQQAGARSRTSVAKYLDCCETWPRSRLVHGTECSPLELLPQTPSSRLAVPRPRQPMRIEWIPAPAPVQGHVPPVQEGAGGIWDERQDVATCLPAKRYDALSTLSSSDLFNDGSDVSTADVATRLPRWIRHFRSETLPCKCDADDALQMPTSTIRKSNGGQPLCSPAVWQASTT